MNDSELEKILNSAAVPEREPGYWEQFPKRVIGQLRTRAEAPGEVKDRGRPRSKFSFVFYGAGLAAACIIIGFMIGFWKGRDSGPSAQLLAEMQKYVREVTKLFPNQVRAIVFDGQGARLVLADTPDVPVSTPVFIHIVQQDSARTVITFSGQKIRIDGENCEVLLNAQGEVLLVGPTWLWCSSEPRNVPKPYQIEARVLEAVL